MNRIRKLFQDQRGSSVPLIAAVSLVCLLIFVGISEYMHLMIVAAGVKDAMQEAVIGTINDNYNEVYHAVREGYAAGYEPDEETFQVSIDYGDVLGKMGEVLGMQEEGEGYVKRDSRNWPEFSIHNIHISIQNAPIASAGSGAEYLADASVQLVVPVSFAGDILPEMRITVGAKAKYMPKF